MIGSVQRSSAGETAYGFPSCTNDQMLYSITQTARSFGSKRGEGLHLPTELLAINIVLKPSYAHGVYSWHRRNREKCLVEVSLPTCVDEC